MFVLLLMTVKFAVLKLTTGVEAMLTAVAPIADALKVTDPATLLWACTVYTPLPT